MRKLEFCRHFVHLQRKPICFDGRPYLPPIYKVTKRNLVLRSSRQTEKSTFLVNTILYEACRNPGVQMLFVPAHGTGPCLQSFSIVGILGGESGHPAWVAWPQRPPPPGV